MLRSLRKEFAVAVGAGEAAIRIDTDEIHDCVATLADVCEKRGWELRVFDPLAGVEWFTGKAPAAPPAKGGPVSLLDAVANSSGPNQPANTLVALHEFWKEPAKPDSAHPGEILPVILVVKNFHLAFAQNREMLAAIIQHTVGDKISDHKDYEKLRKSVYDPHSVSGENTTGKFVVGLMPAETRLPAEVSPLFKHLVHELPDEAELRDILDGIDPPKDEEDSEDNAQSTSPEDRKKICKFALGLTRLQAEGVFSACMVQWGKVIPQYVWEQKSAILNKEGLVELYQGKEKFADVAGLNGMKEVIKNLLTPDEFDDADPDVRAKGVLACGPPGVGKSLIAKAAGNELGYPTLMVNPGNWFGGIVGESEAKTRKGFQILRAHAPCVAVIDEVEKVMPSSRGHQGDGGVSARMEGTFLTAMNDMPELIFWVFTANDVRRMHEAFFRAERVDGVFYVRLPGPAQRAALWKLYGKKFFPKEVRQGKQTVPFPRHMTTSFTDLLDELKKTKKLDATAWANKFTLPLMCLASTEDREKAVEKVRAVNEHVAAGIKLVNDEGWSPAEIRACCRLARRLKEPLSKTQTRVRPVSVSAAEAIERLEEWAAESALDAETGEVYAGSVVTATSDEDGPRVRSGAKKAKRKVRRTG